jgi:hypothetical protein
MTLVVAFTGRIGAVICGDRREIRFYEGGDVETLEHELYNGSIRTDDELMKRASSLGVPIEIRDDKNKIFLSGDHGVLVGVVTSRSAATERQRRMYLAPGRYLIAEVMDGGVKITKTGESVFLAFGSAVAQKISYDVLNRAKQPKKLSDAVALLMRAMESVSQKTASVSRAYDVMQTPPMPGDPEKSLRKALLRDVSENCWRML